LTHFIQRYAGLFHVRGHENLLPFSGYLHGLLQLSHHRNMDMIGRLIPDVTNGQQIQHFISTSHWENQRIRDQIIATANGFLGGHHDRALIIDETSKRAKGHATVGVTRQYLGCLGKVDSGQVWVTSVLYHAGLSMPIMMDLFLPECWATDRARCLKAEMPKESILYHSNIDLALTQVRYAIDQQVDFRWVLADAGYGKSFAFRKALDELGKWYVCDMDSDSKIYLTEPIPVPTKRTKANRDKPQTYQVTNVKPIKANAWANAQVTDAWETHHMRKTAHGPLTAKILRRTVWIWHEGTQEVQQVELLIRKDDCRTGGLRVSLSNAGSVSPHRLAQMQSNRYWVERSFQDTTGELGLKDYRGRSWTGWQHHMTLVMLASLFILESQYSDTQVGTYLRIGDIVSIFEHLFPRKTVTEEQVVAELTRNMMKRKLIHSSA
jgi:SRSO17 transposase